MWLKKIVLYKFTVAAWAICLICVVGIFVLRSYLPPLIPLFYGKPIGIEELAQKNFLFLVPAIAIIISILNLIISKSAKDEFLQKILAVGSFVVSLMAIVTVFKIILLVAFI